MGTPAGGLRSIGGRVGVFQFVGPLLQLGRDFAEPHRQRRCVRNGDLTQSLCPFSQVLRFLAEWHVLTDRTGKVPNTTARQQVLGAIPDAKGIRNVMAGAGAGSYDPPR